MTNDKNEPADIEQWPYVGSKQDQPQNQWNEGANVLGWLAASVLISLAIWYLTHG